MKKFTDKKIILIISIIVAICVGCIIYISLPWIALGRYVYLQDDPDMPEVTSGEFSFKLEYKINEEVFILEDTLICEYYIGTDGNLNKTVMLKEKWCNDTSKYYVHTLYRIDDEWIILYDAPSAEYFMGEVDGVYDISIPDIYLVNTKTYEREKISLTELSKEYKFELLDYVCDEPIDNSFK